MKLKIYFSVLLLLPATICMPEQTAPPQTIELQVMLQDNLKDVETAVNRPLSTNDRILTYKVVKVLKGFYLGTTVHIYQHNIREAIKNNLVANHVTYIYTLKLTGPAQEGRPDTYEIVL